MENNELELLVFIVNGLAYGINVAKVGEIVMNQSLTPAPDTAKGVRGMLKLRDKVIPVVDLKKVLNDQDADLTASSIFIITNFNNMDMAFIADGVSSIQRYKWANVSKPGNIIVNANQGIITGVVNTEDNKLVSILDFEKIISDIDPTNGLNVDDVADVEGEIKSKRNSKTLLISEDSKLLNKMITDTLLKAGYHVVSTFDGQEAWDLICRYDSSDGLLSTFQCLITDIEMPVMDGLTLIENINSDGRYQKLPVTVFSSLVNESLQRKVDSMRIDAMVTKPDVAKLVETVDSLIL